MKDVVRFGQRVSFFVPNQCGSCTNEQKFKSLKRWSYIQNWCIFWCFDIQKMISNIIAGYRSLLFPPRICENVFTFSAEAETQACFKLLNFRYFLELLLINSHRPFIYRERTHVNSKGFNEFCIRNIERHSLGRREIELAELEMPGILALRQEDFLNLSRSKFQSFF